MAEASDHATSVCSHCNRVIPFSNIDLHYAHHSRGRRQPTEFLPKRLINSIAVTLSYVTQFFKNKEQVKTEHKDYFYLTRDEAECPTCLEEYTVENPRITSKCNHHFHLGCIYEWMERSTTCPICSEEMKFDENM